ncbi:hypothetical protein Cpap_3745 [Ruminiclostridium papyrosolvens DSM 2782]|uniref:Uncharacterized protein n=1 Tax=Ruminiclostridium papyrosolvens DSM 2782 TaxID=588581 RepID=F1T765_9FIRM|nr:hypothetical protein [Ruminiclostridium papyrosolvens]EGD49313.1 hypothetical protein Cpap_3745 [Ruminiclostridium papyrosolvens DSM 2782]WES33558.1 hypothetical protein P0092_17580 [Ruminiclostridium papyrosolvens DSM 2782]
MIFIKKINLAFVFLIVLGFLVRCPQQPEKDIETYIAKNFECKTIKSVDGTVPPILGGKFNYYVSFVDKSNNDCFLIINPSLDKYILVYNNLYIEHNSKKLQDKYRDFIQSKLDPPNFSSEYMIKSSLVDLNVKKGKSNLDLFKKGEVGEMLIQDEYIYMDREKGKMLGPTQVKNTILFDTETKSYYEFDEKIK